MRKNKKLLMFLALNSLATSFAGTTNGQIEMKYDKLYNNMVKNIETGKSNEKNYKLIQDVLNKRNQELKDLYMQGDYIVKPEYLEWQIFFSGFYNEKNRGDNTAENAKYYSNPEKANGASTLDSSQTSFYGDTLINDHFKPYKPAQEPKFLDLGVSLHIKGISKDMADISITDVNVPIINSSTINFSEPASLAIPTIELIGFNPSIPRITTINFSSIPVLSLNGTGGMNNGVTGFFPYGDIDSVDETYSGNNAIISQMDLTSGTITVKTAENPANTPGSDQYKSPGYYSYTLDNVVGAPASGLTYSNGYNPVTNMLDIPAVLPTGVYSNSILNDTSGITKQSEGSVQGILKVIDNPITRIGVAGSNVSDLTITLEGDVPDAAFLEQILHYDEHYMGLNKDPMTGEGDRYTLDDMETNSWITSAEKTELGDKFLDTTLGFTTANRDFQYVENNGTWNLKGSNVVGVNLQAHSGGQDANSIFMNRGNIIGLNEASTTNNLVGKQVAFMFTEGESQSKQEGFDNTGTIEMRAPQSVVYLMTDNASSNSSYDETSSDGYSYSSESTGKHFLYNDGDMKLYGNNNIGVYTNNAPLMGIDKYERYAIDGSWYKRNIFFNGLQRSEIKFFKPLTVLGDQSIGVDIERELNFADSKIKVNVGTEDPRQSVASSTGVNGLENSGNIAGGNALYTDDSVGIYVNMNGNIVTKYTFIDDEINPANTINTNISYTGSPQFTLSDYLLNVGSYSRGGEGLRVEDAGNVILGASTDSTTTHEINLLAGGKNNVGIYIIGTGSIVTADGLNLNIDGSEQAGVQIGPKGTFYHKNGNINVNGTDNTGIAAFGGYGELSGTANINVAAGNFGVYNGGAFYMTGGKITVNGKAAVGVYSALYAYTSLSGGTVRAENGGIGLYSDRNSVMNLSQGINLQAGSKGLLFYNYDTAGLAGKYDVTGTVGATVETGGNAFYVKNGQSLTDYLTNSFTGTGKLDLTMQSGSKLYILEGKGSTMNLTTIDGMGISGTSLALNVSINSASASDFIPLSMDKGTLVLDRNISLDNASDMYNRSEFTSVSVNVNNGVTLSGAQNGQIGTAQKNYIGTTGINEITLNNMGTVSLSGANAVGLAADYGHIINGNKIQVTGNDSIGIVSANGTLTENNGEIVIGGTDTAGIYGVNYLDGATSSSALGYGNDGINIINNNKITSTGTGKVYGIYAVNTAGASSAITLGTLSNIDLRSSNGAVGIYADKTTVTGGGTLTVGENGLGIYAKNSNVNLTGFNLNLYGNNALGFYLDGTTNFAGTGNIDVNGQNIALFNIKSSGTFTNNFNVTSAAGSSYTIGNVNNGTFHYNGTTNLGSNGSLVNGINTAVLLDTASNVTSSGSSVVGASLNGQYTGAVPAGFTTGIEGENRGTIALGDSSAGLYGINGARLLNKGNITVRNASLGMSGTGIGSSLRNNSNIAVGQGSQGMYGSESSDITNTGSITGTASNATGMYADNASAMTINNTGTIDLQGTDTNGIYTKGTGTKTIINSGTIKIGNSLDDTKPGIGIYSENGDTITNNGTLEAGTSSVGVYIKAGTIANNGQIGAGSDGTGIYADQTTVNLNTGSSLNIGDNNGVGVYAINGSNVVNDGITTIGNGSYGFALKSGSNLVNNTAATLGENAVLVYGDGAGTITNNGQLTMTGSNNVGIYTSNGGTITNTADILGSTGKANMGIYNEAGSINNTGNISVGDSIIIDPTDSSVNSYAMGIYGDRSAIENHGDITVGANSIGIYTKDAPLTAPTKNYGNISSNSNGAIGIFADHSNVENRGDITLGGKNSIGIYGNRASNILNYGTITLNNDDSTGIMLNGASTLNNQGTINVNGNNSNAVLLQGSSRLENRGTINISGGVTGSKDISDGGTTYPVPSIVNAGIIRVSENFEAKGIDILIKVDPSTVTAATAMEDAGAAFVSNAVKFYAPAFNTVEPIGVLSGFTTGTHAAVYKFENVFNPTTPDKGGPDTGLVKVKSKSLTWLATPVMNSKRNVDIWMEKIPYDDFTSGLWYEDFGKALDGKYVGSNGNAGKIFDKIDSIEHESDFRKTMGSLAGDVYANMNQREATIIDAFDTSLNLLQDSKNNTKENVKINVITGKGSLTENTDGVLGYDYETIGALALREVERTYRHTFGYSLGYLHTGFEMKDGNESEESVDTIQLGAHSKYKVNDWVLRNDLMGRASIHNVDRNIDWSAAGRSQMNGMYESYSITSDNNLGREISLGKNASVTPYGGLEATYMTRPTFTEDGLESLEVKGNDAWSVKPKLGVELKAETNESKNGWKLKGALDVAYEYELADLNEREYARLTAIEDGYHKLSKPQNDKGTIRTKAILGAEIEDRYGIFLTGDYSIGEHDQDEYRAGVTLKAVF